MKLLFICLLAVLATFRARANEKSDSAELDKAFDQMIKAGTIDEEYGNGYFTAAESATWNKPIEDSDDELSAANAVDIGAGSEKVISDSKH